MSGQGGRIEDFCCCSSGTLADLATNAPALVRVKCGSHVPFVLPVRVNVITGVLALNGTGVQELVPIFARLLFSPSVVTSL